jgi:transcriptional regulator with XRE-family HTH domain
MTINDSIDIRGDVFAGRLAQLLAERRHQAGLSRRQLARASGGAFRARMLKDIENARVVLTEELAGSVALLYGLDLGSLVPARVPLEIDEGRIAAGGYAVKFHDGDVTSLLLAYLTLVRRLRGGDHPPAIDLRRSDIELIAHHLDITADEVIDRFGEVTGARGFERTAMSGMFAGGAEVIGMTGTARGRF